VSTIILRAPYVDSVVLGCKLWKSLTTPGIDVAYSYRDNRTSFVALAKQTAELSQSPSALYDASGSKKNHAFQFTHLKPNEVKEALGALSIHTEGSM
jgi:hypothetical protein